MEFRCTTLDVGVVQLRARSGSQDLTYADVFEAWYNDGEGSDAFCQSLAALPFTAFRWETPAVTASSLARPFECVVLNSPNLSPQSDPRPFAEHFQAAAAQQGVISFMSLGRDARLIVPCPLATASVYASLSPFLRNGPRAQQRELWRTVATEMGRRVGVRPVWLNTAGAGVNWLHVRLDDRPKYYHHDVYRQWDGVV